MRLDLSKTNGSSPPSHRNPNQVSGSSPPDRLLTSREVCARLSIHLKTLQRYCKQGKISFICVGGKHRFRTSAVEAFIADREICARRAA